MHGHPSLASPRLFNDLLLLLQILDLGLNRARDKGALAIAQTLRTNRTLEVLKLRLNLISGRGSQALVSAIVSQAELMAASPTPAAAATASSPAGEDARASSAPDVCDMSPNSGAASSKGARRPDVFLPSYFPCAFLYAATQLA